MAKIVCPQCKAENRDTARFCAECGTPLLQGFDKEESPPTLIMKPRLEKELDKPESESERVLQNRYRIESPLGRGGFGSVYKAWDLNLMRACAIKENLDTSSEAQRQFMREATVLANLSHPNLPRVIDHFIIPDQGQYLVMDFVEGEDLETSISRREFLPVDEAINWILQVTDAVEYLHRHRPPIFHRDIKPANIRITPTGQAMLVDFGLVKVFDPYINTTQGARAISPGYAPPEQYGRGGTDARTDIYGLGATLYHLVTGHEPVESVRRMAGEHQPTPQQINPAVPPQVSEVIARSTELDPANRYSSAVEFRKALSEAQKSAEAARSEGPLATVLVEPMPVTSPRSMAEPDVAEADKTIPDAPPPNAVEIPATRVMSTPVESTQGMAEGIPMTSTSAAASQVMGDSAGSGLLTRRRIILFGGIGVAFLIICLGAIGGLTALVLGNRGDPVQQTLTARALLDAPIRATLTARAAESSPTSSATETSVVVNSEATHQAELKASATALQTRLAQMTGTAEAQATSTFESSGKVTEQAVNQELAGLEDKAKIIYGPKSGALVHKKENDILERQTSSVGVRNFITEVTFVVPFPESVGEWDFGVLFRDGGANNEYRLILTPDKKYEIVSTTGNPSGKTIASGEIANMNTEVGDENKIRIYGLEDRGWLFFNDEFITEFDASGHYSGDIMIAIGLTGEEITGKVTEYKDFTVWSLAGQ
jgi:serine/threonine protein kinase